MTHDASVLKSWLSLSLWPNTRVLTARTHSLRFLNGPQRESEALRLHGKTGDTAFVSGKRICSYHRMLKGPVALKKLQSLLYVKGEFGGFIFSYLDGESHTHGSLSIITDSASAVYWRMRTHSSKVSRFARYSHSMLGSKNASGTHSPSVRTVYILY